MDLIDPSKGGRPYPGFFRARIIAHLDSLVGPISERVATVSAHWRVSQRTVWRWLARRAMAATLLALPRAGGPQRTLNRTDEQLLVLYLCKRCYPILC